MVRKGNLKESRKEQNLRNWIGHTHQTWFVRISLYLHEFYELMPFFDAMDYNNPKGKF